jgi:hypothetical protein
MLVRFDNGLGDKTEITVTLPQEIGMGVGSLNKGSASVDSQSIISFHVRE